MPWQTQLSSLLTTFPCCRAFMGEGQLLTLWTISQGCSQSRWTWEWEFLDTQLHEEVRGQLCTPLHTEISPVLPALWSTGTDKRVPAATGPPKKRDRRQGLYGWITSTGHIWLGTPTTVSAEKCLFFLPPRLVLPMHVKCGTSLVTFQTSILFPQQKCSWNILFSFYLVPHFFSSIPSHPGKKKKLIGNWETSSNMSLANAKLNHFPPGLCVSSLTEYWALSKSFLTHRTNTPQVKVQTTTHKHHVEFTFLLSMLSVLKNFPWWSPLKHPTCTQAATNPSPCNVSHNRFFLALQRKTPICTHTIPGLHTPHGKPSLRKDLKVPGFRYVKEKGCNDCTCRLLRTTLPSHFNMQNINHTVRINFLSLTENMCSSPVSCLSYTGTDDSSAVLRLWGVWCPSAGKGLQNCVPRNPRKNQSPAGKYFFSEVSKYSINNRAVLTLEVPKKTQPPQEEGELYWIFFQQEIAQAVQCHKQPLPSHNTRRKE